MFNDEEWEKHCKVIKRIEKKQKRLGNMINITIMLCVAILIILFFTAPVSAWTYNASYAGAFQYYNIYPNQAICTGYTGLFSPSDTIVQKNTGSYHYDGTWLFTRPNPTCIPMWSNVTNMELISTSGPGAMWVHRFDTYYLRSDLNSLYGGFTAVPTSGNETLNVTFYPFNGGKNLERVVWDFDGGLGSQTLTTNMNDTFYKVYPRGHWTVTCTIYNTSTSITSSQNINVYNYTLGITPTPTLTPVPTPTAQGANSSTTWTVTGYDYSNMTKISGLSIGLIDVDDVASGWNNVTASGGEYTFNGYGSGSNKPFVIGHDYMFVLSKSGYQTYTTAAHEYTGINNNDGYYLNPSSIIPTSSNFLLQIVLHDNTMGAGAEFPLVTGSALVSNQSSTWTNTYPVNTGIIFASGLKPGDSYKLDLSVQGYEAYTGYFASSTGMAGTTEYYQAYLTPSNNLPSSYSLSVSPSSGTMNDSYALKLTGDISGASSITYKYSTSSNYPQLFTASSGYTQYSKVGGNWLGWDGSGFTVATSNPTSVNGKMTWGDNPNIESVLVTAYISLNGNIYSTTSTIKILSQGKDPKIIVACDMSAGGGGASSCTRMPEYTSHILDVYMNEWTNQTFTIDNPVNYYYYTPSSLITYYGSADGYYDTITQSKVLGEGSGGIEYHFYKSLGYVPDVINNVTVHAEVKNLNGSMIYGAKVVFSDGQTCYTSNGGTCAVYTLNGITYGGTASAYSYMSAVSSITTSNTTSNVLRFTLLKQQTTQPIYPTNIGGGTGVRPSPTFSNTSGLYTNQSAREEAVCSIDTSGMTPFQIFMNMVACAGITGTVAQGLVFSAVLMFFFAYALSKYGGGMGVLGGVIIGAVVSFGMDILPFWLLIFVVIVCGLLFAKLITSQTGGGQ